MLGAAEMRIRAKASRMPCKARQRDVLEGLGAARVQSGGIGLQIIIQRGEGLERCGPSLRG